ncbi:ALP1-like protein, partial [Tanacetum coccineum]
KIEFNVNFSLFAENRDIMSISSSSSSDGDDDDDMMMMLLILKKYTKAFVDRTPCRTSLLSGKEYIREIICGNPIQSAWAPATKQKSFRGRKAVLVTQNVMVVCSHDMMFTFVYTGWEGTANDSRVFYDAIVRSENKFPIPSGDYFYVADSGYPNLKGFLAPYRGERMEDRADKLFTKYGEDYLEVASENLNIVEEGIPINMTDNDEMAQVRDYIANSLWDHHMSRRNGPPSKPSVVPCGRKIYERETSLESLNPSDVFALHKARIEFLYSVGGGWWRRRCDVGGGWWRRCGRGGRWWRRRGGGGL